MGLRNQRHRKGPARLGASRDRARLIHLLNRVHKIVCGEPQIVFPKSIACHYMVKWAVDIERIRYHGPTTKKVLLVAGCMPHGPSCWP